MSHYIINQFRGLGDILFCMPMIEDWISRGHTITYPIVSEYMPIQKHFPHINFVEKNSMGINYGSNKFDTLPDGSIVVPLRFSDTLVRYEHPEMSYKDCMKSKYVLFGYDWQMWRQLKWKRDMKKEKELYYEVLGLKDGEKYTLCNRLFRTDLTGSVFFRREDDNRAVNMSPQKGFTMLDWGLVIERADIIHTVGTSINYVIEILNCQAKEIHLYIRRPEEKDFSYYDYVLTDKYNYIFNN